MSVQNLRGAVIGIMTVLVTANAAWAQEKREQTTLRWVGCGITKKAFMARLATAWEKKTGVKIQTDGGGATRGIRDVSAGKADLGGSCRHRIAAPEEENASLHPVGWDAIVVINHPKNPVANITFHQVRKVLRGEIKNWKELGGPDQAIAVFTRKSARSGVGLMTRELVFWNPAMKFSGSTRQFKSSGPLEKAIEKSPWAIGLTGISSAKKRKVQVLKVNNHAPTVANIVKGSYPIVRPLYLVAAKSPKQPVADFLAWAKGDGQKLIGGEGTVTLAQGKALWKKYNRLMKVARMRAKAHAKPQK